MRYRAVYYDGNHMGAGGWVFMALIAVVLLGLLAAFVIWLMQDQRRRPHRDHHPVGGSAGEILDRRLATGEISVQEYERVKASLAAPAGPPPSQAEPPSAS
ncbi:MAG TPA: hypothetical protein VMV16_10510 [Solirubrobacteraceae bacterium]|nr:hypothetical protein [Solirubrobacteraceae bacterium]